MAEQSTNNNQGGGPIAAVTTYFSEVRGEVRKVTWPTRPEAWRWTGIVLVVMLFMTILLSSFDLVFSSALTFLVDTFLGVAGQ